MTKQEKIKEAYGDNWHLVEEYVNENGWIKSKDFSYYQSTNGMSDVPIINFFGGKDSQFISTKSIYLGDSEYEKYWRHESLSGIENNNGWIKIESENDLPIDNKGETLFDSGKLFIDGNFEQRLKRSSVSSLKFYFIQGLITHYRPIEKPKPPIY